MFRVLIKLLVSLTLTGSLLSCVSTTTIRSVDANGNVDSNVSIYVDRQSIGKGEAEYSDQKSVYSAVPYYELRKEGCKILREKLNTKTHWFNAIGGAIVSGFGIGLMTGFRRADRRDLALGLGLPISILGLIPLFWTRTYTAVQEQEFQCVRTADK